MAAVKPAQARRAARGGRPSTAKIVCTYGGRSGEVCDNGEVTHPEPPVLAPVAYGPSTQGNERPRRWMVVLTVFWVLVLVAGIGWALVHGKATDREQTTVAQAVPVVDGAAAQVAVAAQADGQAVAVLSGFERIGTCHVSVIRGGEQYQRVVTVFVTPGTEEALLRRIAARLPASFGARVQGGPSPLLLADAGFWVKLVGSTAGPGRVRFVADTGDCRVRGDLPPVVAPTGERASVTAAFAQLNLVPSGWRAYQVTCPGGGALSTVEADGPDGVVPSAANRAGALRELGTTVVSTTDTFAYRTGDAALAVRVDNHHLVVSATTGCP
jgi:hypothetical protein